MGEGKVVEDLLGVSFSQEFSVINQVRNDVVWIGMAKYSQYFDYIKKAEKTAFAEDWM